MRSLRDDRGMRNRSGYQHIMGGVHNSSNQPFHGQPGPAQSAQQNMGGQPPLPQQQQQQPSPGMIPPQQQQQQLQSQANHHGQQNNNLQPLEPYAPPQQNYQASPSMPPPQSLQQRNNDPLFDQAKVYQYLSEKWQSAKQRSADMNIPEKDRPKVYVSHTQWGQGHVQNMHLQAQNGSIEQLIRKKLDEKKLQRVASGSLSQQNSLEVEKEKLPNGTASAQSKGKWK